MDSVKPSTDRADGLPADLEAVVAAVLASAKNRAIAPDYVAALARRELTRGSVKEAIKATKNQLHQVAGAYLATRPPYGQWLEELRAAAGTPALKPLCARLLAHHASTRERLPQLEAFYAAVFAALPPVRTVIDVACGLNPLALPWLPLAPGAAYYAYDIYTDLMAFLGEWLTIAGVGGAAVARDVSAACPEQPADLALVLKFLPLLDQLERGAALRLLDGLRTPRIVVSFPTRSLGGRAKGMGENYSVRFRQLTAARPWTVRELAAPGELVFLVEKPM
ncbi:class I SAM-dependent methyltransferase [Burkholderia cenocepacia]|uniref:16S rRNA methyltransferase n=1 Tax=Burkholderia cenocepacia TaxID=95486 RepID=UPI0013DEEE36|nr:16S rRNA methyltransferase [Burkholderia cenocepacia]MCW3588934.1 hypothetical protein [Burkholderia cenocepacia]MCW3633955.1 hypothetical protein [Burkholderia cenocepacia]MCW5184881.1 hypothetical protein [Burkholderia cenocepacia]NGO92104.1 hypothetical protein [Burkholderia cenocepacia]